MKKRTIFLVAVVLLTFAACKKKENLSKDLNGTWEVYKYLKDGIDRREIPPYKDSLDHYFIEFTSGGLFTEFNYFINLPDTDTVIVTGNWSFEDRYDRLVLTDTIYYKRTYSIFNLEGDHVELRSGGINRYLRKISDTL